jgi:DNA invertase Pin-like site-specific DNA recombinase
MKNDQVEEVHPPIGDIASGKNHKRCGLQKLQQLAENRKIDFLYVSTIDRLGRETVKTLQLLKSLAEADVTVKTVDGEFSFSDLFNIGSM